MATGYVTNDYADSGGAVTIVDLSTNTATGTIQVGSNPRFAALTPDYSKLFVPNQNSGNLTVIDTSGPSISTTITLNASPDPYSAPYTVAMSPDGANAYVANYGPPGDPGYAGTIVWVINISSYGVTKIHGFSRPSGIVIHPSAPKGYVTNSGSNTVSVINTTTDLISATLTVGNVPTGVAITPDGSKLYVTNYEDGTVSVVNTTTNTASATIPVGSTYGPFGVTITADGLAAYVVNQSSGDIYVIDTVTDAVTATIADAGEGPDYLAFSSDGSRAYVPAALSNNVYIINVDTKMVTGHFSVCPNGFFATDIAILPTSSPMTSIYTAPQGRLTLTSGTPVMTADATAQTSVYYTPYQGNIVPIYDGTNMDSYTFAQLTMTLNTTNQTSGNIYDLFVFLNSSVVTIGAGPGVVLQQRT